MTFDHVCTLVGDKTLSFDEYGNAVKDYVKSDVFCHVSSVTRSEFYNASIAGIKAEFTIVVQEFEYNGEKALIYEDKQYDIIRTYKHHSSALDSKAYKDDFTGYIELIAGEKTA